METRSRSFYILAAFFGLFVLFLYGPILTIGILSFQGPQGGLTFPMNGVSLYWFRDLFQEQAVGDIWGSFRRSFALGLMVMVTTVVVSVLGGLAFRKRFAGSGLLFYLAVTSLVIPSILVSLGVGLIFNQLGLPIHWASSGYGSQLTFAHVVLPIIAPSLLGVALFGFTLSYDEFARTLMTAGSYNTLPLEIFGMTTNVTTPVIFALGTLTTGFSLVVIGVFFLTVWLMARKKDRGSDAGKGMV